MQVIIHTDWYTFAKTKHSIIFCYITVPEFGTIKILYLLSLTAGEVKVYSAVEKEHHEESGSKARRMLHTISISERSQHVAKAGGSCWCSVKSCYSVAVIKRGC